MEPLENLPLSPRSLRRILAWRLSGRSRWAAAGQAAAGGEPGPRRCPNGWYAMSCRLRRAERRAESFLHPLQRRVATSPAVSQLSVVGSER